jgi:hypothetical protein
MKSGIQVEKTDIRELANLFQIESFQSESMEGAFI